MTDAQPNKQKFPMSFWTANTIELLERAAYYAMASFMVIYLKESLGMSPSTATLLNGSILWGLIYFLPILSGTLADKFGYKRSLSVAFFMISLGYVVMGNIQRFWPGIIGAEAAVAIDFTVPAVLGIILIGIGGSIVKPCIAGTVQKTSGRRATLGFGIFYMIINIGSISGRGVSYFIRINLGIPAIFTYASTIFALIGLAVVLFIYKEPEYVSDGIKDGQKVQKKTLGQAILGIFIVLSNIKFMFFMIVIGLFWFLYVQLYNLVPLFLRYIDPNAPVELYQLANPVMIVSFQMLITRMVKKWTPVKSIILGAAVVTTGMFLNVLAPLLFSDTAQRVNFLGLSIPLAGLVLIASIASMATGEMMASPRIYEYLGAVAPKGEEGLFTGYANLPLALASIIGGPIGGRMFENFINTPQKSGLPVNTVPMWLIISGIGVISMIGLIIYDKFLSKIKDVYVSSTSFFSWKGRLNRVAWLGQWLSFSILSFLLLMIPEMILKGINLVFIGVAESGVYLAMRTGMVFIYIIVPLFLISFPMMKRLHDLNKPDWHFFLLLIPIINIYLLLICFLKKGTSGPNQYGHDPLAPHSQS